MKDMIMLDWYKKAYNLAQTENNNALFGHSEDSIRKRASVVLARVIETELQQSMKDWPKSVYDDFKLIYDSVKEGLNPLDVLKYD